MGSATVAASMMLALLVAGALVAGDDSHGSDALDPETGTSPLGVRVEATYWAAADLSRDQAELPNDPALQECDGRLDFSSTGALPPGLRFYDQRARYDCAYAVIPMDAAGPFLLGYGRDIDTSWHEEPVPTGPVTLDVTLTIYEADAPLDSIAFQSVRQESLISWHPVDLEDRLHDPLKVVLFVEDDEEDSMTDPIWATQDPSVSARITSILIGASEVPVAVSLIENGNDNHTLDVSAPAFPAMPRYLVYDPASSVPPESDNHFSLDYYVYVPTDQVPFFQEIVVMGSLSATPAEYRVPRQVGTQSTTRDGYETYLIPEITVGSDGGTLRLVFDEAATVTGPPFTAGPALLAVSALVTGGFSAQATRTRFNSPPALRHQSSILFLTGAAAFFAVLATGTAVLVRGPLSEPTSWNGAFLVLLALVTLVGLAGWTYHQVWFRGRVKAARAADAEEETRLRERATELETYLHGLTHDLKTPIIALDWLANDLEEDLEGADTQTVREALTRMRSNIGGMERLVTDLMEISRVDQSDDNATADLREVVEQAQDQVEELRARNQTQIVTDQWSLPVLRIDPGLARQAIVNLLGNAIKYGKQGGTVFIRARPVGPAKAPTHLWLEVEDDGPGVPEDERERITGLFQRGSTSEGVEGTGLGLALVSRIAARYDGRLLIESGDVGSRFVLEFPHGRVLPARTQKKATE